MNESFIRPFADGLRLCFFTFLRSREEAHFSHVNRSVAMQFGLVVGAAVNATTSRKLSCYSCGMLMRRIWSMMSQNAKYIYLQMQCRNKVVTIEPTTRESKCSPLIHGWNILSFALARLNSARNRHPPHHGRFCAWTWPMGVCNWMENWRPVATH